jgi:hypothetical protein
MSDFSTHTPNTKDDLPIYLQDFYANIDTMAFSLQRIAQALDVIAGFDTND